MMLWLCVFPSLSPHLPSLPLLHSHTISYAHCCHFTLHYKEFFIQTWSAPQHSTLIPMTDAQETCTKNHYQFFWHQFLVQVSWASVTGITTQSSSSSQLEAMMTLTANTCIWLMTNNMTVNKPKHLPVSKAHNDICCHQPDNIIINGT